MPHPPWHIWIDTGGTFTDCLARDPQGQFHRAKVLSSGAMRGRILERIDGRMLRIEQNWSGCDNVVAGFEFHAMTRDSGKGETLEPLARVKRFRAAASILEVDRDLHDPGEADIGLTFEVRTGESAPILAARLVTQTPAGAALPRIMMRLATTWGTNALLERRGAPTAMFITEGFGDLLLIGDQQRPEIFALEIVKPPPLCEMVIEVPERIDADGTVLRELDVAAVETAASNALAHGVRGAAIALLHSYRNPTHEIHLAAMLRRLGFEQVSCSSDLAPLIKILPRAQTALVDAYLEPVIGTHLKKVSGTFSGGKKVPGTISALHVMTSAGGLVRGENYRAADSLLSGPAGGVAGAAAAARRSGFHRIIGFDMGGTSTDVARFDGDFDYRFDHAVAGVRLMAPALNIESVAAGGGSICDYVDDQWIVGPQSAGADPGPACYGAGGPFTITDVNLLMGRLSPERFEIPVSHEPAKSALAKVMAKVKAQQIAKPPEPAMKNEDRLLDGFLEIANQRMAAAIEQISICQGYDPREYALVAFGGAGGQHACAVADHLGITTIILPQDASLLSALGLGQAAIERFAQRQILKRLDDCEAQIASWLDELAEQARREVAAEGVPGPAVRVRRRIINLRLQGQDFSLALDVGNHRSVAGFLLRDTFAKRYSAVYGHAPGPEKPVEVESLRVVASAVTHAPFEDPHWFAPEAHQKASDNRAVEARVNRTVHARFGGSWKEVPACERDEMTIGYRIDGPALVFDRRTTLAIETGWSGQKDSAGAFIVRKMSSSAPSPAARADTSDLVRLEVFTHRLTSIAASMGQMLERVAVSTNVKERLDFSCAVLDADGELVVNAPHLPVHLGALGACVRAVRDVIGMNKGDVIITNHPAYGGSHLPDVTVITPVFSGHSLIGYVANRAHHAEIGGTRPGSMPPNATSLIEEGVVIAPRWLVRAGQSRFDEIEKLLRSGPHPSRAVADILADLRAALAANQRGADELKVLAELHGINRMQQKMEAIKTRSERLMRDCLASRADHGCHAIERLDDGSPIEVRIDTCGNRCVIDFTGSAGQHPGNLNATPAIVRSAVMYVLRLMIGKDLPLNEGLMRAVEVIIPPGMLNPTFDDDPRQCPAVVGGNVETSQRIVDTLLKALNLCACSQGTMNNVLFGNERFGYYETLCGGAGAGPGFHGAHAVHTHMTNTRITDPEIIEHRYPVRLERFGIRRGSGGAGQFRGGDGARREFTFLEPMSLSILSQHRVEEPFGLHGGNHGMRGTQRVLRASGELIALRGMDAIEVQPGDRLVLETPGGGGFGRARDGG